MKYFIVKIFYEEKEVIKDPISKDYIVETVDFPSLSDLYQSPKYNIDGYRRVGLAESFEISKLTAESLVLLKDTPPIEFYTLSLVNEKHG